ncbi:UNVERIFIED_CONTAM: hypothetical protein Slati_3787000 [Sesamum latifolium]|uniref:Uncharacterized protein n=1 Tax=Sesamum latifolium TaxID=2727402 RepID=A0AAW2U4K1_9LAMI
MDPVADPPRRSTSSDTSTEELSPALLRAIQHVVAAALREHVPVAAPTRVAPPPEADAPNEEDEEEIQSLCHQQAEGVMSLYLSPRKCLRNGSLAWSICKKVCRT